MIDLWKYYLNNNPSQKLNSPAKQCIKKCINALLISAYIVTQVDMGLFCFRSSVIIGLPWVPCWVACYNGLRVSDDQYD